MDKLIIKHLSTALFIYLQIHRYAVYRISLHKKDALFLQTIFHFRFSYSHNFQ